MLSIETHFFPLPSTLEIILSASCACQLESVANLLFVSADLNTVVTQSPESEGLVVGSVDWGLYLIFFLAVSLDAMQVKLSQTVPVFQSWRFCILAPAETQPQPFCCFQMWSHSRLSFIPNLQWHSGKDSALRWLSYSLLAFLEPFPLYPEMELTCKPF